MKILLWLVHVLIDNPGLLDEYVAVIFSFLLSLGIVMCANEF